MKILLIKPYNRHSFTIVPPLGLGYLATALRKAGHRVIILDCVKEKISPHDFALWLAKTRRFDLFGLSLYSTELPLARAYLQKIKIYHPQAITVIGGPHPSAMPKQCFSYFKNLLDYAFIGEAEIGFSKLANKLEKTKIPSCAYLQNIPGLVFRAKGKIIKNRPHYPHDLDSLGFPSWDLLKPESYPPAPLGGFARRYPVGYLLSSRSCPYHCTFCAARTVHGPVFRRRSLSHVMREVKYLVRNRGIKEIHILDDNFTLDRRFVQAFCQELIRNKYGISWNCSNGIRLDQVDEKTLKLMKKSGCYSVPVGIESGSPRILKQMNKSLDMKTVKKQVSLIRRLGFSITGLFIIGFPGETISDIKKTIAFAKSLALTKASFGTFIPLPGSRAWNTLSKQGKLNPSSLKNLSYYQANKNYTHKISNRQFKSLQKKAYLSFYLRPKIICSILKEISTPAHLFYILKRSLFYIKSW